MQKTSSIQVKQAAIFYFLGHGKIEGDNVVYECVSKQAAARKRAILTKPTEEPNSFYMLGSQAGNGASYDEKKETLRVTASKIDPRRFVQVLEGYDALDEARTGALQALVAVLGGNKVADTLSEAFTTISRMTAVRARSPAARDIFNTAADTIDRIVVDTCLLHYLTGDEAVRALDAPARVADRERSLEEHRRVLGVPRQV